MSPPNPPFLLEYVYLPTIRSYNIQRFALGPELPIIFMMVGPKKLSESIPARRYSIKELLGMKSSLPYVSCPLNRFKPEAWTENLLCRKKVPSLPESLVERRGPKRYVAKEEETILDTETRARVGRLIPEMNFEPGSIEIPATLGEKGQVKEAAQRQPVGPATGNDGKSAGFGRAISQTVRAPPGFDTQLQAKPKTPGVMNTEEISMTYGSAVAAAAENHKQPHSLYGVSIVSQARPEYASPIRQPTRYNCTEMAPNQDTPLSTQELIAMGVPLGIQMVPVMVSPYASPERYSNRPTATYPQAHATIGHRVQSPQVLAPGGNLKAASTTGLAPAEEASGTQWASMDNTVRSRGPSMSANQSPLRSQYYAGVGSNQQENAIMSDTYRGIQPVNNSKHGLWVGHPNVVLNLPPPDAPGPMLGSKITSHDQLSFIEYMTKRIPSGRYVPGNRGGNTSGSDMAR